MFCLSALQKSRTVSDAKSQLEVLFHTWLPWGWELGEELKAILGSAVTCHTWLQITLPFLTCQGSNCLCPSCYWGNTITSLEMDTAAVSRGKRTAPIPTGYMLPLCCDLSGYFGFVAVVFPFDFWALKAEAHAGSENLSLRYRDKAEVPDYISKIWMAFFNQKAPSWQDC